MGLLPVMSRADSGLAVLHVSTSVSYEGGPRNTRLAAQTALRWPGTQAVSLFAPTPQNALHPNKQGTEHLSVSSPHLRGDSSTGRTGRSWVPAARTVRGGVGCVCAGTSPTRLSPQHGTSAESALPPTFCVLRGAGAARQRHTHPLPVEDAEFYD